MGDSTDFAHLFREVTNFLPYGFQERWATGDRLPGIVSVPTGLGKTAGAFMAWLWRRRFASNEIRKATPRRLAYCLPMRVLVEQTCQCVSSWVERIGLQGPGGVAVHVLMGGDIDRDWDRFPEQDAVLIGTQDQLLSRALNRGYAMSRYRWPVQFGLLNNDCHWVFDEVQLMGNGLATSVQLQAFRRLLGTMRPVTSTWMSATLQPDWLQTVDFVPNQDAGSTLELNADDKKHPRIARRIHARKPLSRAAFQSSKDGKPEAALVIEKHHPATLTLVVVNTVKRAVAIYEQLLKKKPGAELVLVHSRFRAVDRKRQQDRLLAPPEGPGTIAVTTQVVEAGVDLSATTLVTDLAPWPSLVQRFGRCNRQGQDESASVTWLDVERSEKASAPYEGEELNRASEKLEGLQEVSPAGLPPVDEGPGFRHVVRRRDLIELFDTTPDLAGADLDISRFIREDDDYHVQVFWRNLPDDPSPDEPAPNRDELCAAPIADLLKTKVRMWRWDLLERCWSRVRGRNPVYPGLVLLLAAEEGGYSAELGWTGRKKDKPALLGVPPGDRDDNDADKMSERSWQTLADHTDAVFDALEGLLDEFSDIEPEWKNALRIAGRWHDAGKAHPVFQKAMLGDPPENDPSRIWAKTQLRSVRYERPGFRHELASALAMIAHGLPDLAAYLAAAHHGKVRLSIRSMPHEAPPKDDQSRLFARGIWHGDTLPATALGGATCLPETALDLGLLEMGDGLLGPSWLSRILAMRNAGQLGPFRLALLEAILRVADWRASDSSQSGSELTSGDDPVGRTR